MSRIYKSGTHDEKVEPYQLKPFSEKTRSNKADSFKCDADILVNNISKGFIKGGFDFPLTDGMKAEEIINEATKKANIIIKQADSEAKLIKDLSKKEGFEQGFEQGYQQGIGNSIDIGKAMKKVIEELETLRESFYKNAENELIDLVNSIAYKVIKTKLDQSPEIVKAVIEDAVLILKGKENITILINPEDAEHAKQVKDKLAKDFEDFSSIKIEYDISVNRGGCIVRSNFGSIDARIETELEKINKGLKGEK